MNPSPDVPNPAASDSPLSLVRPSWADPFYIFGAYYYRRTAFTIAAPGAELLVPADPRRVAVIFPAIDPVTANLRVGVFSNPSVEYLGELTTGMLRFTLFEFGPLVCEAWYANANAFNYQITVYEILTQ
jgi:hypothetical protein